MIPYPRINPVIVKIGPLQVRWYGVMYLLGFLLGYLILKRVVRERGVEITGKQLEGLMEAVVLGVIIGGRLGYVLFYNLSYYLHHPLEMLAFWHGGMSFHGGLLGTIVCGYIYCRKAGLDFWKIADSVVVAVPVGLGLGRLGNFINGELYGRVTNLPWGMVFPGAGLLPRHPSQIYEFLLEGVVLFTILWLLRRRPWPPGRLFALFLVLYGLFRFFVECFRQPDPQLGVVIDHITMGQVLSSGMVLIGLLILFANRERSHNSLSF